jgi:hypothetical protein
MLGWYVVEQIPPPQPNYAAQSKDLAAFHFLPLRG